MRNDQYFKHDATAAYGSKLASLLRAEGAKGYSVYWFLLEAIRMQSNYCLSFSMLDDVVRKCRVKRAIVLRVVCDYNLFEVENDRFFSPGLNKRMKNFERKVNAESSQSERKQNDNKMTTSGITPLTRVREEKKENCSSSKEKPAAAIAVVVVTAAASDDEKPVAVTVIVPDSVPPNSPSPSHEPPKRRSFFLKAPCPKPRSTVLREEKHRASGKNGSKLADSPKQGCSTRGLKLHSQEKFHCS